MPTLSDLVSPEYLDLLHKMRDPKHMPRWGAGGQRHTVVVRDLVFQFKVKTVLDYGCGHGLLLGELMKTLPTTVGLYGYDPGIAERAALPAPADLVVSTDVLEHIEPECLTSVLQHIRELTLKAAYMHIHTGPANAKLPDGRNAHLIQKPDKWWFEQLQSYYRTVEPIKASTGARKGGQIFGDYRPTFLCQP